MRKAHEDPTPDPGLALPLPRPEDADEPAFELTPAALEYLAECGAGRPREEQR